MARSDWAGLRASLAIAPEDTVIELARTGDIASFEELIRRRQSQLRQLLRRLCSDASLADDLSQETFVRAWQALPSLRENAAFWSWLRRIAARTWIQHAQRQRLIFVENLEETSMISEPVDSDRHDLDAALARLSPPARACMVMAYQAGMTHSEIAETLGLPLGTVKTHITRSTQVLRQWFGVTTAE